MIEGASNPIETVILGSDIPPSSRVVVAVSGGPDSVALLAALNAAAPSFAWSLVVAHVNHQLRGEESEIDEKFVKHLADEMSLPAEVRKFDTATFARENRLSIETAARQLRYGALRDIVRDQTADVVVTGHTREDQAETVLLHLLRGSGLTGLEGIHRARAGLVRPFLGVSHQQILEYLQERGLGYRLDSSNEDLRHLRNRVRKQVIPELERIQPRAAESIARAAQLLQSDADYLLEETEEALRLAQHRCGDHRHSVSRDVIRALHPALQRSTIRLFLGAAGCSSDIDATHIEDIVRSIASPEDRPIAPAMLPGGVRIDVRGACISVGTPQRRAEKKLTETALTIPGHAQNEAGEVTATILEPGLDVLAYRLAVAGPYHAFFDASRLGHSLLLRSRRPGDRARPAGVGGSKKVQDILVDLKIPADQRDRILLISTDTDIVWIPGCALDERVAASGREQLVAHLIFRPAAGYPGGTIQRPF
jgi:tRNA(Ile)-lysidine synthase